VDNITNVFVCSELPIDIELEDTNTGGPGVVSYTVTTINDNGLTAGDDNVSEDDVIDKFGIASDTWRNTTGSNVDVVYTLVPLADNGCEGEAFTVTVTIRPMPDVANQTKTICSDSETEFTLPNGSNIVASTYNITAIDVAGDLVAAPGNAVVANGVGDDAIFTDSWTNTTSGSLDVVYTITPISAEGCEGDDFTVTMTVNPEPVVGIQSATLCSKEPSGLTLSAGTSVAASTYNITNINDGGKQNSR